MDEKTGLGIVYPALLALVGVCAGISVAAGFVMFATASPETVRAWFIGSLIALVLLFAASGWVIWSVRQHSKGTPVPSRKLIWPVGLAIAFGIATWWAVSRDAFGLWLPAHPMTEVSIPPLASGSTLAIPAPARLPQPPPGLLLSLYMTEYNQITGAATGATAVILNQDDKPIGKIYFRIVYDKGSHSKFVVIYIPKSDETVKLALAVASQIKSITSQIEAVNPISTIQAHGQGESNPEKFTDYPFSTRVYIYHETPLGAEDVGDITKFFDENGLSVQLLGDDMASGVWDEIQLGFTKPLPEFELTDTNVCIKGPLAAPLPNPAPLCTPGKTSPQTSP